MPGECFFGLVTPFRSSTKTLFCDTTILVLRFFEYQLCSESLRAEQLCFEIVDRDTRFVEAELHELPKCLRYALVLSNSCRGYCLRVCQ